MIHQTDPHSAPVQLETGTTTQTITIPPTGKAIVLVRLPLEATISRPQRLAVDRQIHSISAGSGDPPGADCSVLIIPPEAPGSNLGQNHTQITRWSHALRR